ncbi:MAG: TlpA disulfide reductase family protein [Candidatus Omnitrophota bacterium]
MVKNRTIVFLASFFLLFFVIGCSGSAAQEGASGKAPEFTLKDIDGNSVQLSDFSGNVVILDFFASWCPPCKQEIPDFIELSRAYGPRGFTMLGISLEAAGPTKRFADKMGINYPVLLDDGKVSGAYGPIRAIPTTFVIDRNGNFARHYIGYRPKNVFEKDLEELL